MFSLTTYSSVTTFNAAEEKVVQKFKKNSLFNNESCVVTDHKVCLFLKLTDHAFLFRSVKKKTVKTDCCATFFKEALTGTTQVYWSACCHISTIWELTWWRHTPPPARPSPAAPPESRYLQLAHIFIWLHGKVFFYLHLLKLTVKLSLLNRRRTYRWQMCVIEMAACRSNTGRSKSVSVLQDRRLTTIQEILL